MGGTQAADQVRLRSVFSHSHHLRINQVFLTNPVEKHSFPLSTKFSEFYTNRATNGKNLTGKFDVRSPMLAKLQLISHQVLFCSLQPVTFQKNNLILAAALKDRISQEKIVRS